MLVVKIGGCNGSGKTSLVRALMAELNAQPITHPTKPKKHIAYVGKNRRPVYILGSYQNSCGGMDTISDKHERFALVEQYAQPGNVVVFEGLITGKTYGALGELSERPGHKGKWVYTFMDTPFEVCVKRVLQRRKAAGNHAEFDPERTMRSTFKAVQSVRRKAIENDHYVFDVSHKHTPEEAANALLTHIKSLL